MQKLKLIKSESVNLNYSEEINYIEINGGELLINSLIKLESQFQELKEAYKDFYKSVKLL